MGWILGILLALVIFFIIVDILDLNRFVVRTRKVVSDKIKKPVTLVFLSDLHNQCYGKENKKLLRAIAKQAPDFVVCGGDMIIGQPGRENGNAVRFMDEIARNYTCFYALGNHEYRTAVFPDTYGKMYEEYTTPLKEKGVVFLHNEGVFLEEYNLEIKGLEIDKHFYKKFTVVPMEDNYVEDTLGKKNEECFTLLLAHNPDYFPKYEKYGAELTLSGHLHGGLVRFPFCGGIASPAVRFFPRYNGGMYRRNGKTMIVSCGLGTHTLPVRIFNPGELTVIKIEPAE